MSKISQNLERVTEKIANAAQHASRDPASISLVAVSKTVNPEQIEDALKAGHRSYGENRVQEAESKWPRLREIYGELNLHLIGALQTNKVRAAVGLFDVIETLDRPRLASALAKEMESAARQIPCFIQVNTGEEPQKAGILPGEADAFIEHCRDELGLLIHGLMCIPPSNEEPSLHFSLLHTIAERQGLPYLSMGMSADYEIAVSFGATHVRVGRAIFGERATP
ncbi:MAG: YggS family pyridoxal phosphate-dependent enzyme [Proteobacteria bacterium]|nr:YggS family pyridoxal phosphate-dependent enzyme [Pseudomonadota bacterium]